ncbi:1,4-dihydroxy-2-naphthoate polyprenyltransferase [Paenibacillus sp. TRM 82003]|nr:1,4-dihydroxy-2-naphthoate polyprenyltransferase [Paenibacillus sp. TRM 82003]
MWFWKLVEIRTKVASMIPFAIGTLYAMYRFESFDTLNFTLMFVSLLCIDMTTTAINNFYDYKKARKKEGYGYESHNAMVKYRIGDKTALAVIFGLFLVATGAGIALVTQTGLVVLLLGAASFGVGILYSFGPVPISRMPLGELFSGLFMGFLIIFLSAYVHTDDQLATIRLAQGALLIDLRLAEIAFLFVASIPAVMGIANIMLANNICDMEEDVENKRYTLPIYIGKANALRLFRAHYVIAYADIALLFFLGVHPLLLLLIALTWLPARRNIARFVANPEKDGTFALSVQNFALMSVARIAVLGLAVLIG